ncbi:MULTISPECIES: glycoside hydrolase family 43 protein [Actinoalloteichus]|uniref:Glycosyl hydrolase family 43 n=1 Tax=Actinoalloteichus fjordicus TaxID=1612552 RepID=A0AAC9LFX2_9PSEU|nr:MULTISPECIES: glycoside hydrolase family 43 protein [Actinoalloteichus]APU15595.1 glycosyl hydrolase family 43 [Actinoalloteichus fjordicus]APU21655.1 glycosyl hydrolase family 43 [Actinoalloteichus sp. GBA129-24]
MDELRTPGRRGVLKAMGLGAAVAATTFTVGPAAHAAVSARPAPRQADQQWSNPIIRHIHTADPAVLVHQDRVYLYAGRDVAAPGATDFLINDWHVFSSDDLTTWTDHGPRLSWRDFSWSDGAAYASQCVERDGRFYWYVPIADRGPAWFSIGVAVGDSPLGPFRDARGTPLVSGSDPSAPTLNIDPTVYVDPSGRAHLYWGSWWELRYAPLADDMISLAGPIQTISGLPGFWEAPFLHRRNDLYYLSYAAGGNPATIDYATSSSPTGPWTFRGTVNGRVSSPTNHQAFFEFRGRWYIAYHTSDLPGGTQFRRSVCLDRVEYDAAGLMLPVQQTRQL